MGYLTKLIILQTNLLTILKWEEIIVPYVIYFVPVTSLQTSQLHKQISRQTHTISYHHQLMVAPFNKCKVWPSYSLIPCVRHILGQQVPHNW